jgi:hypothetical protein
LRGPFELAVLHFALEQPPRRRIESAPFGFHRTGKLRGAQGFDAECDHGRIRSAVVHLASHNIEAGKIYEKRIALFLLRRGWLLGAWVTFGLWRRLWYRFLDGLSFCAAHAVVVASASMAPITIAFICNHPSLK